jgi:peptidoglycan glycosyltransferase
MAVTVSCDTTFALIGLRIFPDILSAAEQFGFNTALPFDLSTAESSFPNVPTDNKPFRAYQAVGQGDTVATPLQMALVAATVANGGVEPRPRLVKEIVDPSGGIVQRFSPESLRNVMSSTTSATITKMMESVVQSGTGTTAQIPGVSVAGKTGTAQTVKGAAPHAWFICFAPAQNPKIAVAVLVEHGGSLGSEATGGAVSAPIAKQIIEADRQIEGW